MITWRERRLMRRFVRDYEHGRCKIYTERNAKMIESLIRRGYVSKSAFIKFADDSGGANVRG